MTLSSSPQGSFVAKAGPSVGASFLATARQHARRPALVIGEELITYEELAVRAGRIGACLQRFARNAPTLGAIFGSRTFATYEGLLGTLLSGAGYVPLNPKFPDARNAYMLAVSGASTLVLDAEGIPRFGGLVAQVERPLLVVVPHVEDVSELAGRFPQHTFVGTSELAKLAPINEPPAIDPDAMAYLLFTSGTTGTPKGVMVNHRNVLHHLALMRDRYGMDENDRVSQTFDTTFDLSVFDIFATLTSGASLHVLPAKAMLAPDKFIREHELTVWYSVPSIAMMMRSFGLLDPETLPSLRLSMFCGERLPASVAAAWQAAAPKSRVDNLYGPTEVTISCTGYTWNGAPQDEVDGGVPIGEPYPGMTVAVVDEQLHLVEAGERGELCMRGPQVVPGYWLDEAKTNERFVQMPWWTGPDNRWYRTGDVAYLRADGQFIHCGRNDDQVKLHGQRIELGEIEKVLGEIAQTDFVAVVAHPRDESGPRGLVATVAHPKVGIPQLLKGARTKLAPYMIPQQVIVLDEMPLNANGKIDKKRVLELVQQRDTASSKAAPERSE